MKDRNTTLLKIIVISLCVIAVGCERKARVYGVAMWNAGCGGANLSLWDDMGLAWYNEVTNTAHSGAYKQDGQFIDGNIIDSMFTDTGVVSWGNDHNNIDIADAGLIFMHGSENNDRWQGSVRVDEAGAGDCQTWQGICILATPI